MISLSEYNCLHLVHLFQYFWNSLTLWVIRINIFIFFKHSNSKWTLAFFFLLSYSILQPLFTLNTGLHSSVARNILKMRVGGEWVTGDCCGEFCPYWETHFENRIKINVSLINNNIHIFYTVKLFAWKLIHTVL